MTSNLSLLLLIKNYNLVLVIKTLSNCILLYLTNYTIGYQIKIIKTSLSFIKTQVHTVADIHDDHGHIIFL